MQVFLDGLRLHPCDRDKAPRYTGWQRLATADRATFARLWHRRPGPLIGVVTGVASGIDVIDVDPRNSGDAWLRANEHRLPATRRHRTRSGGDHFIFKALDQRGRLIAPGVELKANNQNLVWWPAHGLEVLVEGPVADFPDWLIETARMASADCAVPTVPLFGPPTEYEFNYARKSLRNAFIELRECREDRNEKLNRLAYSMGRQVARDWIPRERVEAVLMVGAADCGLVQEDGEAKCRATIASGLNAGMLRPYHNISPDKR